MDGTVTITLLESFSGFVICREADGGRKELAFLDRRNWTRGQAELVQRLLARQAGESQDRGEDRQKRLAQMAREIEVQAGELADALDADE